MAIVISIVAALGITILIIETKDADFLRGSKYHGIPYSTIKTKDQTITEKTGEQIFELIPMQSSTQVTEQPPSGVVYFFDVETGQDIWNTSGAWYITDMRYNSPSHSFHYGIEMEKSNGSMMPGGLISPVIYLNNTVNPVLSFMSWFQGNDTKLVQISDDDENWKDLKQISHDRKTWVREEINLFDHAGKKIRIRFFVYPADTIYGENEGWYIDDIRIKGG